MQGATTLPALDNKDVSQGLHKSLRKHELPLINQDLYSSLTADHEPPAILEAASVTAKDFNVSSPQPLPAHPSEHSNPTSTLPAHSNGAVRTVRAAAPAAGPLSQPSAVDELRAQVSELSAHNAELAARCALTEAHARRAQARVSRLEGRLIQGRAQRLVDRAVQVFRRHVASAPPGMDPSLFIEGEAQLVGAGGCARVYAWESAGRQWVVKADYMGGAEGALSSKGGFELERCADLLPSLLPPHPNIGAPVTWWVGPPTLASDSDQDTTDTTQAAQTSAAAATAAAAGMRGSTYSVASDLSARPPCFTLYTVHERYDCSLAEHMDRLRAAKQAAAADAAVSPTSPSVDDVGSELMDLRDVLVVVRDIAAALHHLASHSVAHSDVKPENVTLVFDKDGRVERAVLIDFGLSRLIPLGDERVPARGGTWMFKAPEQLTGPCMPDFECDPDGIARRSPYVCRATDTFALGLLICYLAHGGDLKSRTGLPLGLDPSQVLKWGDRPNARKTGYEPFYMTAADVLPHTSYDDARSLLRQLARGCLASSPDKRMTPVSVRAMAAQELTALRAKAGALFAYSFT